jgi:hypothetical protein
VGLRGRVCPIDLLKAPYTGREGVYVAYTVERWDRTPNVLGHGGQWLCTEHSEEATPFELTDGETMILVDPHRAEFLARSVRGAVEADPPLLFSEAVIEPDAELTVVGQLTEEGGFDPSAAYRGTSVRQVVAAGSRGLLLAPPRELAKRLAVGLLLGPGAAVVGLLILVGAVLLLLADQWLN